MSVTVGQAETVGHARHTHLHATTGHQFVWSVTTHPLLGREGLVFPVKNGEIEFNEIGGADSLEEAIALIRDQDQIDQI